MILQNKNAVIYGAAGSIGSAVARAFAKEGAHVFLTGKNEAALLKLSNDINGAGGKSSISVVDALDEKMVNDCISEADRRAGGVDISFNAIGIRDVQGTPLAEMRADDFLQPIMIAMKTQFITAKAASRVMIRQRRGVILSLTATPAGMAYPLVGGFGPACSAMEGFSRNLAAELGAFGIRVVNIRSAGSPDSRPFIDDAGNLTPLATTFVEKMKAGTMLNRLPMLGDIGNVATFLASESAAALTGTTVNVTCGTTRD